MKVDHIFICADMPDKFSQILTDFGLTQGEPNIHTGQGTANRRFFFENIYFQFLAVKNEQHLKSLASKPSRLYERFTRTDDSISPFGICLYPSDDCLKFGDYPSIDYRPKFIHPPLKMSIFLTPIIEPMYYFVDYISDSSKQTHIQYKHEIGFEKITRIKIHTPDSDSKLMHDLNQAGIVEFETHDNHLMEITFDDGEQNKTQDFRPEIPLIFNW